MNFWCKFVVNSNMKNLIIILSLFLFACKKETILPNAISPNGDGINDNWVIPFEFAKVVIFERSGVVVFESNPYLNNWSANGLPDGTYFYQINDNIKGFITVKR